MEKDIRQQFINFLKKQKCYDNYMENLNTASSPFYENVEFKHFLQIVYPKNWIGLAFHWANTLEGYEYWNVIYRKWIDYLDSIKKQNNETED